MGYDIAREKQAEQHASKAEHRPALGVEAIDLGKLRGSALADHLDDQAGAVGLRLLQVHAHPNKVADQPDAVAPSPTGQGTATPGSESATRAETDRTLLVGTLVHAVGPLPLSREIKPAPDPTPHRNRSP